MTPGQPSKVISRSKALSGSEAPTSEQADPRARLPRRVVLMGCAVVALIAVGTAIALALPAFRDRRAAAEWRATTFSFPDTIENLQRMAAPAAPLPKGGDVALQRALPGAAIERGVYRDNHTSLVVIVLHAPKAMPAAQESAARRQLLVEPAHRAGVTLTRQVAGPLGGWFACGSLPGGRATECAVSDPTALITIVASGKGPQAVELARTARKAIEHRR